ncbi:MAG: HD domain-containing protein [Candidatus Beckwithbacteria bacterium]|nr:HD domain-containing protein [Candidatus Beckwithbacteria bacterium]
MLNKELISSAEGRLEQYKADHSFRVMYLAREIFRLEAINAPEEIHQEPAFFIEVLDWAGALHDTEMKELNDFTHGQKAAEKVDQIIGDKLSEKGRNLVKLLCNCHWVDDNEIYGLNPTEAWLLKVFKDADNLDGVRFSKNGILDESRFRLRFQSSRELIGKAGELWGKTHQIFETQYQAFNEVSKAAVEIGLIIQ